VAMLEPKTSDVVLADSSLAGKHIVICLESLELGGAEQQALLLARCLREQYHLNISVVGFSNPGRAADLCDEYGIPWRIIPVTWSGSRLQRIKSLHRLLTTLRSMAPDILLPYTVIPNLLCGLVWRWTGAQLCVWNQRDEGRHLSGRRIERLAAGNASFFLSNSQHGAEFLMQHLGVPRGHTAVVYNGVTPAAPKRSPLEWRWELGVSDNVLLACMVANIHEYKDHETLLRAWRGVLDRWEGHRDRPVLLLAGRPHAIHTSLRALAFDLDLGRSVRFLGKVGDISGLLATCHLGVFSSRYEGCPNGVLECMAAGLPIAATDIPGIREAVGEDGLSYLAPPGDAEALTERICTLLGNYVLRSHLGELNRQRIAEHFSPARLCEQTVQHLMEHMQ